MSRRTKKANQFLLIPEPKYITYSTKKFNLTFDGKVASNSHSVLLKTAVRELFGVYGKLVNIRKKTSVHCEIVNKNNFSPRIKKQEFFSNEEAYSLEINQSGAKIYAAKEIGLRYGLMTLGQLIKSQGTFLPELTILDWPHLTHRGYMMALVQGHNTYKTDYAQHVVKEMAKIKLNALYLYIENSFQFPFDPQLGGKRSMTPKQAKALDRFASSYGIEVIPMLNVLGHASETLSLEHYQQLAEYPEEENPETFLSSQFCPSNPMTLELVKQQIEELSKCFSSDIIHVGGDEAEHLGKCPRCKKIVERNGLPQLFANYFNAIQSYAKRHGKRIGIWGDMPLHHRPGGKAGDKIHAADLLNRSIFIYDWHYDGGSPDTLKYFSQRKFDVVASTSIRLFICNSVWPGQETNQCLLFRDCPGAEVKSGLITNWTNYMGAHVENFWLLVSNGADTMWSCRKKRRKDMLSAFSLQRYGLRKDTLTHYINILGSTHGEFYNVLGVMNNTDLRQTLYHTDNPLTFWYHYNKILTPEKVKEWNKAICKARKLWIAIQKEYSKSKDKYLMFLEAPLLVHEHLYKRYIMTVGIRKLYSEAAHLQTRNKNSFILKLLKAAEQADLHAKDFEPLINMLDSMTRSLGMESYSRLRLLRTIENVKFLAKFLRYLAQNSRDLPLFAELHNVLFERALGQFWISREDEWANAPTEFSRYSIVAKPWTSGPKKEK